MIWACQISFSKQAVQAITAKQQDHSVFKVPRRGLAWSGPFHTEASPSPAKEGLSDQRTELLQGNSCLPCLLG